MVGKYRNGGWQGVDSYAPVLYRAEETDRELRHGCRARTPVYHRPRDCLPAVRFIGADTPKVPDEYLVDGGYANHDAIDRVSEQGSTVYAPVQKPKDATRDPHTRLPTDSNHVGAWRERMGTDEAKVIYKDRASTAECVNAIARNRGLQQFQVRGRRKVKAVLLWYALAHNMMRSITLALQPTAQPQAAVA